MIGALQPGRESVAGRLFDFGGAGSGLRSFVFQAAHQFLPGGPAQLMESNPFQHPFAWTPAVRSVQAGCPSRNVG